MMTLSLAMQNAILGQNMAQSRMMGASNAMLSTVGYSQPLRPSFGQADTFELQNKADETRISVYQKMMDSIEKALGKSIARSTPKYGGIDYKA